MVILLTIPFILLLLQLLLQHPQAKKWLSLATCIAAIGSSVYYLELQYASGGWDYGQTLTQLILPMVAFAGCTLYGMLSFLKQTKPHNNPQRLFLILSLIGGVFYIVTDWGKNIVGLGALTLLVLAIVFGIATYKKAYIISKITSVLICVLQLPILWCWFDRAFYRVTLLRTNILITCPSFVGILVHAVILWLGVGIVLKKRNS